MGRTSLKNITICNRRIVSSVEACANIGIVVYYYDLTPAFKVVNSRRKDEREILSALGIIAYVIAKRKSHIATNTMFGEYYHSCKEQYYLEHMVDVDAWRRNLYEEFYDIHIRQEEEKIRNSSDISDIVSEEDAILLGTYANEYLQYAQQRIKEERGDNVEITPEPNILPNELNTNKAREVLSRGINAGLIDDNFQPIKGKMTKGQMKIFALCASIECGIQHHFKIFENLWHTKNLAQTREYDMKEDRIKQIEVLFSKDVVGKYKLEKRSR